MIRQDLTSKVPNMLSVRHFLPHLHHTAQRN
jgi:hypothetical protein